MTWEGLTFAEARREWLCGGIVLAGLPRAIKMCNPHFSRCRLGLFWRCPQRPGLLRILASNLASKGVSLRRPKPLLRLWKAKSAPPTSAGKPPGYTLTILTIFNERKGTNNETHGTD